MQTFLPYPNMKDSMRVLDYRRLGKQRLEARQILTTLTENKVAWANHPAVLMWRGFEDALRFYFNTASEEWIRRGYKHTMGFFDIPSDVVYPWWLGDEDFHFSHRSNLFYKSPCNYYGWTGIEKVEYVWPVTKEPVEWLYDESE